MAVASAMLAVGHECLLRYGQFDMYLVYLPLVLVLVRRLDRDVATDDVSAKPVESLRQLAHARL